MTFAEAAATQPQYLQLWFAWLIGVMFVAPLALLIWRNSRVIGVVGLGVAGLMSLLMPWLYDMWGYVRLLGLGHVVLWTPLLIWMWPRLPALTGAARIIAWTFWLTLGASLIIDYIDVIRWLLGDRATLVPVV
ncbi:MAG: hypothetical protein AB8B82_16355 [Roseovarius sp.]